MIANTDFLLIICLLVGFVLMALGNLATLGMMWRLRNRYERFRYEVGRSFEELQVHLDDHDMRLTAAGFPPTQRYTQTNIEPLRGPQR